MNTPNTNMFLDDQATGVLLLDAYRSLPRAFQFCSVRMIGK